VYAACFGDPAADGALMMELCGFSRLFPGYGDLFPDYGGENSRFCGTGIAF
jgi:hypothetical protein